MLVLVRRVSITDRNCKCEELAKGMEADLANLNLDDLEDDPIAGQKEDDVGEDDFRFCLVGRVLTDSSVHFPSLRNVLSELWHPIEGVTILKIEEKQILFRFFNEIDLKRMLDGIP
ncbi:hypothetical protein J1N35_008031 [Gossypium stocksii]|uniref:DUF4283 domain-containing protein n=1 Tax=Gossypium stocksii TaxID=47602 RepID=A0A9D3W8I8_9ROSI|nr:hypothetical protein J1N35_008031 [Gossypium stocksii]